MGSISINEVEANKYFELFVLGSEKGLAYVYNRFYRYALNYAHSISQDNFEIKSVVQDVFLLIWIRRKYMKDISHIKHSIPVYVRWRCRDYFKQRQRKNTCIISPLNFYENSEFLAYDPQEEKEQWNKALVEQELLQLIQNAIPYLPGNRKIYVDLYRRGFSCKNIAKFFGLSYQHIAQEISRGTGELKPIATRLRMAADASKKRPIILVSDCEIYLNKQQVKILRLRENNYDFSRIAEELNMTQFQVLKQYSMAMEIYDRLKGKRKGTHIYSKSYCYNNQ